MLLSDIIVLLGILYMIASLSLDYGYEHKILGEQVTINPLPLTSSDSEQNQCLK